MKTVLSLLLLVAIIAWLGYTPDSQKPLMLELYTNAESEWFDDGVGGQVHYRDTGPKEAPALILIHGSNASLHTWEAMAEQIDGDYRVIRYDQHGHGLTGPHAMRDYSASAKISTLIRLLDHLGVSEASLIGSSMGGWVAWRAALVIPERVENLVLIDAYGMKPLSELTPYLGARLAQSWLGQQLLPYSTPRWMVKKSVEENYVDKSKIDDALVDRYWQLTRFPGNRIALRDSIVVDREDEFAERVSQIHQPSLILWGRQDRAIDVEQADEFAARLANATLIVYDDLGHLPMEEDADRVAEDLRNWLRSF